MIYTFGDFELDETAYELRREGEAVKLEPKVFNVLRHLVANRDRVVPKTEFLDVLWPGEFVTESALPRAVAAARKALGDDRERRRMIRTVHGRGYQFVAPVRDHGGRAQPEAAPAAPARELPAPVFVGREVALERLEAALDDATAGRGRLVLLFGEPGIGKTRTAGELVERARERGFEAVSGRCYEGEGAPAFWPWVQILRALTEDLHEEELEAELAGSAEALAHLVPELAERLPAIPPPLPPGPDEARFRLFEGVTGYIARRSEAKPLIVFVDDLHWADKPTVLLLRHLVRGTQANRLVVIGAYREVELRRGSPLGEVLGELTRESQAERLPLRGLDRAAVARFIEATTGAACDDALASAVAEITEGNPFFLNETVRLLRTEGALGAAATRRAWDASLPQGLRDVIGRRLDRLSDECNRVLTLASVIGAEFGVGGLARFAGLDPDSLLETLDEAVRGRVISESTERVGQYAFSHALIQQSIYEELSTPERVRLHRQLGGVLEELYRENPGAHLDALAHHFFQAAPGGDVDRAIDYALRAGKAAQRLLAYEEAVHSFKRGLQALDLRVPDDETRRCKLLLELGTALEQAGDRTGMRDAFTRAADCARRLDRADLLGRAALGFSGRTERGMPDTAVRTLLEEALEALGERENALRARILAHLAGTPPYSDSLETRMALSQQAVELARTADDPETLQHSIGLRCFALAGPDRLEERLALATELLEMAEGRGDLEGQLWAREPLIRAHLVHGAMDAADREMAAYRRIAEQLRLPNYLFMASFYPVGRALSTGRFEDAERLMREGLEAGIAAKHPAAGPVYWGQQFWLGTQLGEPERIERALAGFAEGGSLIMAMERVVDLLGAYLDLERGLESEARRKLEGVTPESLAALPRDEHWLAVMVGFTELAVRLGDRERAAVVYDLLRPYAVLNAAHDLLRADRGAVSHFLGVLAVFLGRFDEAADHFEAALEMNARMGARPHLARTQAEFAGLLLARGLRGDAARARALLDEAGATAEDLGMAGLTRRVAELSASPA